MLDSLQVNKNATVLSYQNLGAFFFIQHFSGYFKFLTSEFILSVLPAYDYFSGETSL
jgi:hypothetical protein